jgi:hypothetical protein
MEFRRSAFAPKADVDVTGQNFRKVPIVSLKTSGVGAKQAMHSMIERNGLLAFLRRMSGHAMQDPQGWVFSARRLSPYRAEGDLYGNARADERTLSHHDPATWMPAGAQLAASPAVVRESEA